MAIVLYSEKKQSLDQVAFVRDTVNQTAIRNINNSYELTKQFTILFAEIFNRMGFKGKIDPNETPEIKELILSHFKGLSLDEIAYAFKLERFGQNWEKTDHYQLFNATYVGAVLRKYVDWKREVKYKNNIGLTAKPKKTISEEEKQKWINLGVQNLLKIFKEDNRVPESHIYIYDVLYEDYLPKDVEAKKMIMEQAKIALQEELEEAKPQTRGEATEIKHVLATIQSPKNPKVIMKSKQMILTGFLSKLISNKERLKEFEAKFSNK